MQSPINSVCFELSSVVRSQVYIFLGNRDLISLITFNVIGDVVVKLLLTDVTVDLKLQG